MGHTGAGEFTIYFSPREQKIYLPQSTCIKSECPGHPRSEFETCLELKDFPARQNQLYTILYIALVSIMGCSFKDLIVHVHNASQW